MGKLEDVTTIDAIAKSQLTRLSGRLDKLLLMSVSPKQMSNVVVTLASFGGPKKTKNKRRCHSIGPATRTWQVARQGERPLHRSESGKQCLLVLLYLSEPAPYCGRSVHQVFLESAMQPNELRDLCGEWYDLRIPFLRLSDRRIVV